MTLWVGWAEAFQAVEEASGMEKGYEPMCKLEQDEQDRLGRSPVKMTSEGKIQIPTLQN